MADQKESNVGHGHVILPALRMGQPESSRGYISAARDFIAGAEVLSKAGGKVDVAGAFLLAQALECALKAYLVTQGITAETLSKRPYHHNLVKLWEEAAGTGLAILAQTPQWCQRLNETHDKPYILRYRSGVHGFAIPNVLKAVDEVKEVMIRIEPIVKRHRPQN
jgi:hypothetical protein